MNNQEERLRFMMKSGEVKGLLEALKLLREGFTLEGIKVIAEHKNKELQAELEKQKNSVVKP